MCEHNLMTSGASSHEFSFTAGTSLLLHHHSPGSDLSTQNPE